MPNGKGVLDCRLCEYYGSRSKRPRGPYCHYYNELMIVQDPGHDHFVCTQFQPSATYWAENGRWNPPAAQFAYFGANLHHGFLYRFSYTDRRSIRKAFEFSNAEHPKSLQDLLPGDSDN